MALVLKLHSLAALKALQSDVAVLAATAQEGKIGVDADVVSKLAILIEPTPDTFPFALSLPWDAFSYPLRICLAGAHSYAGDAVLFDDAEGPSISDIVLSGMTPRHVASLLEAVELMTTADVPTGVTLRRGPRSGSFEMGVVLEPPVPGEQLAEAALRRVGDVGEDVGEPSLRVDIIQLGGADEAVDNGGSLGTTV